MHTFEELSKLFSDQFNQNLLPQTNTLYKAGHYFLQLGGKRIRPVLCLMGNELFGEISADGWHAANAIELFHNFTLIHDDIMDEAPLRRGQQTVHEKYDESTALLAGDVLFVMAYEHLGKISGESLKKIMLIFNKTAREVCEGQQMDMEFEKNENVSQQDYLHMIELKTSVLLAASLQMGAMLGGAGLGNQHHIYEFGKNLGIAFQVQDDYLDAFGDPGKFGKQIGGDIRANKKTFLLIHALEACLEDNRKKLMTLMKENPEDKVDEVLKIFRKCGIDKWATELQQEYTAKAMQHLEDVAVLSKRKESLKQLAEYLLTRDK